MRVEAAARTESSFQAMLSMAILPRSVDLGDLFAGLYTFSRRWLLLTGSWPLRWTFS